MKKLKANAAGFLSLILFFSVLNIFTSCENSKFYWEELSFSSLQFHDENIEKDSSTGLVKYSYFDKNYNKAEPTVNNCTLKGYYDLCGFEGKLKHVSGEGPMIEDFGFILNVNKEEEEDTFYMIQFTANGTLDVGYYNGKSIKSVLNSEIDKDSTNFKVNELNTVKVETVEEGQAIVYVNGKKITSFNCTEGTYGAIGIYQMLNSDDLAHFSESTPMVSYYTFTRIQHIR